MHGRTLVHHVELLDQSISFLAVTIRHSPPDICQLHRVSYTIIDRVPWASVHTTTQHIDSTITSVDIVCQRHHSLFHLPTSRSMYRQALWLPRQQHLCLHLSSRQLAVRQSTEIIRSHMVRSTRHRFFSVDLSRSVLHMSASCSTSTDSYNSSQQLTSSNYQFQF